MSDPSNSFPSPKRGAALAITRPERVTLTESGPRDGLQNESREIPLAQKIALADALSATGRALEGRFKRAVRGGEPAR